MMVQHVRQKDDAGCIVASLAIVSGRSYEDVRSEFPDFEGRGGLNFRYVDDFLYRNGFAWQTIYQYHPPGNSKREIWPPSPWADLHMAEVVMPSGNYHSVVMLDDGTVLDPLTDEPRRLTYYEEVGSVRAVYRLPRTLEQGDRPIP